MLFPNNNNPVYFPSETSDLAIAPNQANDINERAGSDTNKRRTLLLFKNINLFVVSEENGGVKCKASASSDMHGPLHAIVRADCVLLPLWINSSPSWVIFWLRISTVERGAIRKLQTTLNTYREFGDIVVWRRRRDYTQELLSETF